MALVLNDRVKETSTSTGTGTINLGGAVDGFETFVAGIGNSNTTYYAIVHKTLNEFEIGIGTITDASPDTITGRSNSNVLSSSNSDNVVNFSAGDKEVFCTQPAPKAVFKNENNDVVLADNQKSIFGDGEDLKIYSDGGGAVFETQGQNIDSFRFHKVNNGSMGAWMYFDHQTDSPSSVDFVSGISFNHTDTINNTTNNVALWQMNNLSTKFSQSNSGGNVVEYLVLDGQSANNIQCKQPLEANEGITVDNITIDGTEIDLSSGNLTIQADAGEISIDAGTNGTIRLKDDTVEYGQFYKSGNNLAIYSAVQDASMFLQGNDGGNLITAVTFDMQNAGAASFNAGVDASTFFRAPNFYTGVGSQGFSNTNTNDFKITNQDNTIAIYGKNGGNVGIGTTNPAQKLTVASEGRLRLQRSDNTRYGDIYNDNSFFNIVTSNDPIKLDGQSYIRFDIGGAEKARIDSSGNLILPQTGVLAFNSTSDEYITATASNLYLGVDNGYHIHIDGTNDHINFRIDNANVNGNLHYNANDYFALESNTYLSLQSTVSSTKRSLILGNTFFKPYNADSGTLDLGTSAAKWKEIHSNGVINNGSFDAIIHTHRYGYNNSRNFELTSGGSGGDVGLYLKDAGSTGFVQLYGAAASYGFLSTAWGNWDLKKEKAGAMDLYGSDAVIRLVSSGNNDRGIEFNHGAAGSTPASGQTKKASITWNEGSANFMFKNFRADANQNYANIGFMTGGGTYTTPSLRLNINTYGAIGVTQGGNATNTNQAPANMSYGSSGQVLTSYGNAAPPQWATPSSGGYSANFTGYANAFSVGTSSTGGQGELRATGNIIAYYSDERLKDFHGKIENAVDKVKQLNGYYFFENDKAKEYGYENQDKKQIGVSAQEVEKVLPEIVSQAPFDMAEDGTSKSGEDYKTVDYEKLVPLLIEAIKEQQIQIDCLKEQLSGNN